MESKVKSSKDGALVEDKITITMHSQSNRVVFYLVPKGVDVKSCGCEPS